MTPNRARELFAYDRETGDLWFRRDMRLARRSHPRGYYRATADGTGYLVHRLIWLIVYGRWPDEIDHINRIKTDNRLQNLRNVSHSGNMQNRTKYAGKYPKGVSRARDRWKARIRVNCEYVHLGVYDTQEEAYAAYCMASKFFHECSQIT
jgi:hypothetical protein